MFLAKTPVWIYSYITPLVTQYPGQDCTVMAQLIALGGYGGKFSHRCLVRLRAAVTGSPILPQTASF